LDLAVKSNPIVKENVLLNFYDDCKSAEKAVISIRDIFPKSRNHLDLAVKSKPTVKENVLLNFYEYCKNVERTVISMSDIFAQKPESFVFLQSNQS
jgi:hypothetical protein